MSLPNGDGADGMAAPPATETTGKRAEPSGPDDGGNPFSITFKPDGSPVYPPELTCPHCSKMFPVPEGFVGSRGPCPDCRKMIVFFERR